MSDEAKQAIITAQSNPKRLSWEALDVIRIWYANPKADSGTFDMIQKRFRLFEIKDSTNSPESDNT